MAFSLLRLVIAEPKSRGEADPLEARDYLARIIPGRRPAHRARRRADPAVEDARHHHARPARRDLRHLVRRLALHGAHHPRPGPVDPREGVRRGRPLAGASDARILFRHILPNLIAPIIVYTTLLIPTNILFEAALSFLGIGVQPPPPVGAR